jgi:hypothetical protein
MILAAILISLAPVKNETPESKIGKLQCAVVSKPNAKRESLVDKQRDCVTILKTPQPRRVEK